MGKPVAKGETVNTTHFDGHHGKPMEGNEKKRTTVWRPKSQQNAKALRSFRDAMEDLRDVLEFRPGTSWSTDYIRYAGRRLSVELRKLLLDGAPLVHRVLQKPRFQPLRDRGSLTGDIYENSSTIRPAPGAEDGSRLEHLAEHTWGITVHPLHGLRFDSPTGLWLCESLFDAQAEPLTLGPWVNQRLFQVDQRLYTLGDAIKFIANKEAVHVDLGRDEHTRDMERVHFGHTTYPHLVTLLVASYVLERYRASRTENAEQWRQFLDMRREAVSEYKIISGGEFEAADIDPLGFPEELHETGIQIPQPGRVWNPVQIREHATVCP